MARSSPRVILSAAISLDGKIATRSGDSALSSGVDKKRLHKLRTQVDAILVGKNTILQDNPMLNVRYAKGKSPIRIVLDSLGQTPTNSKIIQTSDEIQTIVAVSEKIPKKNLDKLAKFPVDIVISGKNRVELKKLLQILGHAKIKTILLEGGGTTNWDFVNQGLVDQVIVTITPYLVGGKDAKTLVDGDGFAKISKSLRLNLDKIVHQGNEIVLYYS
ncbi:MAG: 2,5-diamino-6-(ribosylamino)-4(3H)-pyrimidinone 5'-phosphate reductase [Nitrosopumilaceae archaeon]|nr:2,5-diamino-6-(ribosylamino)-4(3H)-pyrimidinone 5'-phosphate reductase [Nitrosopumilaceae archaeon]NDB89085.1 2,5-diamino-6-(ribosylamino)-4(3H)-pyrimidinone 5'-phosphate reductase [Nitrososphaerota archaeon]NDB92487.1 2,5-diamino-6-(ribosylamino)-4(3H)-pyrimidinone 5'-phosphate reductase [Nitrososphaeria archaeon]NDF27177.1 2,5-diamino-6-(ribosylamino)-4(3H)-pyrimidinone 5'-phosphate reductase [Nitrosopumilaceae archaeon]NDF36029.1 2,5-diamino-6-(ribosylamino)-4(3H)-pyrimidinone 5'-phosphat